MFTKLGLAAGCLAPHRFSPLRRRLNGTQVRVFPLYGPYGPYYPGYYSGYYPGPIQASIIRDMRILGTIRVGTITIIMGIITSMTQSSDGG
jgi:hypothetical protein